METDLNTLLRLIGRQAVEIELLKAEKEQMENELKKSRALAEIARVQAEKSEPQP